MPALFRLEFSRETAPTKPRAATSDSLQPLSTSMRVSSWEGEACRHGRTARSHPSPVVQCTPCSRTERDFWLWYDAVVGAASAAAAEVSDVAVVKWLGSASLQGFERIQHRGISSLAEPTQTVEAARGNRSQRCAGRWACSKHPWLKDNEALAQGEAQRQPVADVRRGGVNGLVIFP